MTYTPVTIDGFRGLDLGDPMDAPGNGASSLLNIDLDLRGRIRMRDGSQQFSAAGIGTGTYTFMVPVGDDAILVRDDGATQRVDELAAGGTLTSIGSFVAADAYSTAAIGLPTASVVYIAGGTGVATTKVNVTAGTLASSVGQPYFLAVNPNDGRFVQGRFTTAADSPTLSNGSPSTVFFSDADDPDSFGANNYVHLHPGDGEAITGMCAWRDMLFVFKQTKMFVFYGTSTDGTGNPVFNYRAVSLPSSLGAGPSAYQMVAGTDGVYFIAVDGIYRTMGGPPERVTRDLDPLWTGSASSSLAVSVAKAIGWTNGRLYFRYSLADSSQRLLVLDRGEWLVWTSPFTSGVPVSWAAVAGNYVYFPVGNEIHRFSTAATDDGTAISWHWQGGFSDLGDPADKVIRETVLWGTGSPTVAVLTDHGTTDALAAAVTLGVSPAVAEGYHRIAYNGKLHSLKLSGTTAATINRATFHVRDRRMVGAKS